MPTPVEMDEEMETTSRTSRFKEGTMNSTASIVAPPDELWKGLEMDEMMERFHDESAGAPASAVAMPAAATASTIANNNTTTTTTNVVRKRPAVSRETSANSVAQTPHPRNAIPETSNAPVPATDGPFSRFSRAVSAWFNGSGFSALGKRKAGSETAERRLDKGQPTDKPADVKELEERYRQMKEQGMFKPTITTGPRTIPRVRQSSGRHSFTPVEHPGSDIFSPAYTASTPMTPTPNLPGSAPGSRTPALYKTPSKRDLSKQKKLSKRVSDLEHKLQEARRELSLALSPGNPNPLPPLPALPQANLPPTPKTDASQSASDASSSEALATTSTREKMGFGKIVKKRKTVREGDEDSEYKPVPTESDTDTNTNMSHPSDSEILSSKRSKLVRKKSSRPNNKRSIVAVETEQVVTIVPDGLAVPEVPHIPQNVSGKRVPVSPDGYGGLEHEMF